MTASTSSSSFIPSMAANLIAASGEDGTVPGQHDFAEQPPPSYVPTAPTYGDAAGKSHPQHDASFGAHASPASNMPEPDLRLVSQDAQPGVRLVNQDVLPRAAEGLVMPEPEPYVHDHDSAPNQTLGPTSNNPIETGSTYSATAGSAYSTVFDNIPMGVDLNSTAGNEKELEIPAIFFGIPFPSAVSDPTSPASPVEAPDDPKVVKRAEKQAEKAAKKEAKKEAKRPALLLYALPRAPYRKPPPTENGKPGKQKLVKRVERKWQEEVAEANRIHEGEVPDASRWKKMKAPLARKADQLIQWLPDSTMSALQRIPPKKRLKQAIVFVPTDPEFSSPEKQADLERQLLAERKGAIKRTWISGLLLPVTETLDFFNPVPVFAFEVNLAYFAYQLQGLRKATALTSDDVNMTLEPNANLEPLRARLAALCNAANQRKFPHVPGVAPGETGGASASGLSVPAVQVTAATPEERQRQLGDDDDDTASVDTDDDTMWDTSVPGGAPPEGRAGGRALAEAIVTAFRAAVPPEIAARHQLDDLDALGMDIERCLRKGVKEYMKTV